MEQIKELGEKTARAICHDGIVLTELRGVLYHDYHTFAHSANVAFYCVLLARSLGITSYDDLSAIATGGLLHDAGKLDIPADILTKPSSLSDDERQIMRRHPTTGFRKLCHRRDLSLGQLMSDISRQGACFLHRAQLFPGQRVELTLPTGRIPYTVMRCLRHHERCFETGAELA